MTCISALTDVSLVCLNIIQSSGRVHAIHSLLSCPHQLINVDVDLGGLDIPGACAGSGRVHTSQVNISIHAAGELDQYLLMSTKRVTIQTVPCNNTA